VPLLCVQSNPSCHLHYDFITTSLQFSDAANSEDRASFPQQQLLQSE
jgi:hypothetical protein